ncbi:hypothetical protein MESS4_530086 [Mesorhizobium sp. STM 4661]|nr:hypothetical protein MESS4_530086 [Mesorhizobium sp. STM 4661]
MVIKADFHLVPPRRPMVIVSDTGALIVFPLRQLLPELAVQTSLPRRFDLRCPDKHAGARNGARTLAPFTILTTKCRVNENGFLSIRDRLALAVCVG